jgi:hypothetical protein
MVGTWHAIESWHYRVLYMERWFPVSLYIRYIYNDTKVIRSKRCSSVSAEFLYSQ